MRGLESFLCRILVLILALFTNLVINGGVVEELIEKGKAFIGENEMPTEMKAEYGLQP